MGIAVGTKTVTLEKRYAGIHIEKELNQPGVTARVRTVVGYYDAAGEWRTTDEEWLDFTNDQVMYMFNLTPSALRTPDDRLGTTFETVIYGVLSGLVPVHANLDITITDHDTGLPIPGKVVVQRGNNIVGKFNGEGRVTGQVPLVLGARLVVLARVDGAQYDQFAQDYPALVGDVTMTVPLRRVQ